MTSLTAYLFQCGDDPKGDWCAAYWVYGFSLLFVKPEKQMAVRRPNGWETSHPRKVLKRSLQRALDEKLLSRLLDGMENPWQ